MERCLYICALTVVPLAVGCAPSSFPAATPKSSAEHAERYVTLPGLSSTPHAGLQAELSLLQQEQMTPQALDAQGAGPASRNAANRHREALSAAIPAISRPLLKAQLDEVDRSGPLRLNPVQLERAREISRRWADDRVRFEQAIAESRSGLALKFTDGPLADLQFLDAVQLGCRLEALVAVDCQSVLAAQYICPKSQHRHDNGSAD